MFFGDSLNGGGLSSSMKGLALPCLLTATLSSIDTASVWSNFICDTSFATRYEDLVMSTVSSATIVS